jgi:hypothetical protein
MNKLSFNVGTIFCYECITALRKFIGSMKGSHLFRIIAKGFADMHWGA